VNGQDYGVQYLHTFEDTGEKDVEEEKKQKEEKENEEEERETEEEKEGEEDFGQHHLLTLGELLFDEDEQMEDNFHRGLPLLGIDEEDNFLLHLGSPGFGWGPPI
jgi:hypothetical protein